MGMAVTTGAKPCPTRILTLQQQQATMPATSSTANPTEEARVLMETAAWSLGAVGIRVEPTDVLSVDVSGGVGICGGTDVFGDDPSSSGSLGVAGGEGLEVGLASLVPALWVVLSLSGAIGGSGLGGCERRAGSRTHCSVVGVQSGLVEPSGRTHWMRVEVPAWRL